MKNFVVWNFLQGLVDGVRLSLFGRELRLCVH